MKTPIAVLINDIHLNKDNGDLVKSMFRQVISVCEKNGVSDIICGGDVFTNRSGQPLICLTDWKEVLEELKENSINFHVIPGNHDKTDRDDEKSYLDVYSGDCEVYRTGSLVTIGGVVFCMMPYFSDEKWLSVYDKIVKKIDFNKPTILITHMGFDGVRNNDGTQVESTLKPSMFKKFTNVLIGHYHNASSLTKNVHYTGSLYQNNHGETVTDKGCTLIYSDGSIESIPLKFSRYIKEVIDVDDKESLRNLLEKYGDNPEDHVRFVFIGNKSDATKIDLGYLTSKGIDAQFQAVETEKAITTSEDEGIVNYDKTTLIKDFMKFCSENSIKGEHLKFGLSLIKSI